jgi:hypothetical protein
MSSLLSRKRRTPGCSAKAEFNKSLAVQKSKICDKFGLKKNKETSWPGTDYRTYFIC